MFKRNIRQVMTISLALVLTGGLLYYLVYNKLDMYADVTTMASDTTPPVLAEVTVSGNSIMTVGDSAWVTFKFSESIRTVGNLLVSFSSGGSCNLYVSNLTGGNCSYQVLAGQNTDKLQVAKITGTITDMAGNNTVNPMPMTNISSNIKVDTTAPVITGVVASTGSDNYLKAGDEVEIGLRFSKPVTSVGPVKINMNVGSGCTFTVTSSDYWSCKYKILDGENTTSLSVVSVTGVIKDKAGIAMTNFVPQKNISPDKTVVVDTVIPKLLTAIPERSSGFVKLNDTLKINFKMSEPGRGYSGLTAYFNSGNNCYFYFSSSDSASCTIKFNSSTKNVSQLKIDRVEGSIADLAGNTVTNPIFQQGIDAFAKIGIDLVAPTITITSPQQITGGYGSIDTYDDSVRVTGSVNDDLSGVILVKYNGNGIGSTFDFNVATPRHGDYSISIEAQDAAGNSTEFYYYIYRGYGNAACNPENTVYQPLSLTTINVPIWKYTGKKVKVKVVTYKTITSKVKKRSYDKKKRRYVTKWVTVTKKKKVTSWVWVSKPKSGKEIVSSSMNLKVNSKCANEFREIFTQVYNSPDRQIINPAETACYRKNNPCSACRHDYGVACDINVTQNAAFRNGAPYAGSFWKPGGQYSSYYGWSSGYDILSIPPDGAMARAFEALNFGGQLGGDYMHFSIDGW